MAEKKVPIVKKSLLSWIKEGSLKLQLALLLAVLVAVAARVLPLEMQKRIVNEAIGSRRLDQLFIYGGVYFAAFITATGLKYLINMLRTMIGQQMVAEMRNRLFAHILTLPLSFFRGIQPGLVIAAVVKELATAGDFIGMAVAVPVTHVLMLAAFIVYLLWLNPLLAVMTMSIYPIMFILVPRLQKRVNLYNKKRLTATRNLSGRVGEAVDGIQEIQGNGAFRIENEKFREVVAKLKRIRIIWNLYKFGVKAVNNLLTNFGRFLVFAVGGYLAIEGRLELGALVAFLSAQEKLYEPWKELVRFYQAQQQASVTYRRTMDFFDIVPQYADARGGDGPASLDGGIDVKDLSVTAEDGTTLLERINLSIEPGQHLALVGFSGSGKSTLAQCIVGLRDYKAGRIEIDRKELRSFSLTDIVHNIGFVAQFPFIFDGTVEENLLYACLAEKDIADGASAGGLPDQDEKIQALQETGMFVDVLGFGLNSVLGEEDNSALKEKIIRVRKSFHNEVPDDIGRNIEVYQVDRYLDFASMAENIIFGTSRDPRFSGVDLTENDYFMSFLASAGLEAPLVKLGRDIARQVVIILKDSSAEALFFENSPIPAAEMDDYRGLLKRLETRRSNQSEADRKMFIRAALRFIPARHKMASLSEDLKSKLLTARRLFKQRVSEEFPGAHCFYQFSDYLDCRPIMANIIFGNIKDDRSHVREKIHEHINRLLIKETCLEDIVEIGMQYRVGSKGDRLSGGQRRKLAIARAALKKPVIFVLDEATSGLDNRSQARIQTLLASRWKGSHTVIAVAHRLNIVKDFDKIAVMKAGKVIETGTYDELMEEKGALYALVKKGG